MLDSFSTHVNKHKPNIYYFSAWEQLFKLCAGLLTSDTLTSEHLCLFTVPALGTLVSLFGTSLQLPHSPAAPPTKSDKAGASADLRRGPDDIPSVSCFRRPRSQDNAQSPSLLQTDTFQGLISLGWISR